MQRLTRLVLAQEILGSNPSGIANILYIKGVKNLAQHVTIFASEARTAIATSYDISNPSGTGLVLTIVVTAAANTPSVTFTIEGKDPTSGTYYTILTSAAITGTGTTTLRVHPDLTAATNTVAKDMLPAVWRVKTAVGDTDSLTYSVGASMI